MRLSGLTCLYSNLDIAYNEAMNGPYEDLSVRSDDCEIIAGLKHHRISGFWRPMVAVGTEKVLKAVCKTLWHLSGNWYFMDFLVNGELSVVSKFLLEKGYKARPVYTQVIDLTRTKEELHADLRKSYKSLVNKTEDIRQTEIWDFKELHTGTKGETRSLKTWHIQEQMKPLIYRQGDCAVMFYYNENCAYYASAVGENVHALIWRSIETLKAYGVEKLELGEQVYYAGQQMMDGKPATEKNMDISFLKRGFGGETVTRLILERPYS